MLDYRKLIGTAFLAALGIGLTNVQPASAQSNVLPGPTGSTGAAEVVPAPVGVSLPVGIYTPPAGLRFLGGQSSSWSEFPLRSPSPIFMTSINYPGVYGAYYYGAAPSVWGPGNVFAGPYTLRPSWTTLPPAWATPPSELIPVVKPEPVPQVTERKGQPATITIYTPEPASVWVQDQALPGNETENHFTTPALVPNQLYKYEVTAMWSQDGVPVKQSRTVVVQSGEKHVFGFHRKPMLNSNASPGTRSPE
jgi:uncharacterized protein (TIGR03000 family)